MGSGGRNILAYEKALKWQILKGSLARRLIIRGFIFGIAIASIALIQFVYNFDALKLYPAGFDECGSDLVLLYPNSFVGRVLKPVAPNLGYARCKENVNLTVDVVRELLDHHLLNYGSRALCLGPDSSSAVSALRELGFSSVDWVYNKHPFFGRKEKEDANQINYKDNSFDFLIARDLDKVSIPALIVSEMERVLKPGGIGAVILYSSNDGGSSAPGSLIRSAMPVSTYLKGSSVVHVTSLNPRNTLVAFKKNFDHIDEHRLPADCPSLRRNKPYVDLMEPLVEAKPVVDDGGNGSRVAFLPDFLGITSSSGMQLVYVDMGKREAANFSHNNWFLPSYPIESRAFSVYIVDHNALVLSSHVQKPGVNFIYHPGLSDAANIDDDDDGEEISMDEEEFDFLAWFKEAVAYSDLVVLRMNAGRAQLKFLYELFESGAICSVDELFLECSESDLADGTYMDLFKKLRSSGLFVHQWWSN